LPDTCISCKNRCPSSNKSRISGGVIYIFAYKMADFHAFYKNGESI